MNSRDLLLLARMYHTDGAIFVGHGFGASVRRLEAHGLICIGPGGNTARLTDKGSGLCKSLVEMVETC